MSKYQDSTTFRAHGHIVHTFQKYFWFRYDLLMISHFVKIMGRWKLFLWKTPKNDWASGFLWGSSGSKNSKFWNSRKLRCEKIMSFWDDSLCFLYFWSIFIRNTGRQGPLRVQKNENFGSSQKHPKSIGIDQESIFSHFGTI